MAAQDAALGGAEADAARAAPRSELQAYSGDPDFMASLARGLAVIRAFQDRPRRMTIAQLSQRTGIPRAAVRRCLYTLAELGYVSVGDRSFALTARMLGLGHAYLSSTPLVVAAQPLLDRVTAELDESSSLTILEGDEVLYVARSATRRIMSVALQVGSRLPAYCTSMGQVLLAHLPAPALDDYLNRAALIMHTPFTLTQRAALVKRLVAVRHNGFAVVDQELEAGLRSVAVPVRDASGSVVAAINASGHSSRVTISQLEQTFLPALERAARELSAAH